METKGLKLAGLTVLEAEKKHQIDVVIDGIPKQYVLDIPTGGDNKLVAAYALVAAMQAGNVIFCADHAAMLLGVKQNILSSDFAIMSEALIDKKPNSEGNILPTYFCVFRDSGVLGMSTSQEGDKRHYANNALKPLDGEEVVLYAIRETPGEYKKIFINEKFREGWEKRIGRAIKLLRGEQVKKSTSYKVVKSGKHAVKVQSEFVREVLDPGNIKQTLTEKYDFPLFGNFAWTPDTRPNESCQVLGLNLETGLTDTIPSKFYDFLTCTYTGKNRRSQDESEFDIRIDAEQESAFYVYSLYLESLTEEQKAEASRRSLWTTLMAEREKAEQESIEKERKALAEREKAEAEKRLSEFKNRDDVKVLDHKLLTLSPAKNLYADILKKFNAGTSFDELKKNPDVVVLFAEKAFHDAENLFDDAVLALAEANTKEEKSAAKERKAAAEKASQEAEKAWKQAELDRDVKRSQERIDSLTAKMKDESDPNVKAELEMALAEAKKVHKALTAK
jgi:hypothetical protein